jgi:23S rRNA (cytidine1920-2'-O)/16S rRNA (cytidine1409-2'-O)-methyltransferase
MRLDQELVKRNLCESRTEAQELITSGFVFVDGGICSKQTKQVTDTTSIEVTKRRNFVSRGGEKLKGALNHLFGDDDAIGQFCLNKKVLDVGSSTGGFTDCLLSYGVLTVDAVDVGTNQLHPKIKNDSRVTSYENTDIRSFKSLVRAKPGLEITYDIIVADLSFIPLEHVFDDIIAFGKPGTSFILLIKPQFEVGKGNTKKGIVREDTLVLKILDKYKEITKEKGFKNVETFASSLQGGDGNQEYFLFGVL